MQQARKNAFLHSPSTRIRPTPFPLQSLQTGGHRNKFVEGQNPSLEKYVCPICEFVASEAHQATCCGRIFCKICLRQQETAPRSMCPNCHGDAVTFPDTMAAREISQLLVHCNNRRKGCNWTGKLGDAKLHHTRCFHSKQECPNGCSALIAEGLLGLHTKLQCPRRLCRCDHCKLKGRYDEINGSHLLRCPDMRIPCPNTDCKRHIQRKYMDEHRQGCPKEEVVCPYANVGCDHVCLRDKMLQHKALETATHLDFTSTALQIMSKTCNTVIMTNFSGWQESGVNWHSPGYYSSPGGYKMGLSVFANGRGEGAKTHLSVYIFLYEGDYDEFLEWPLRGEFSIELLNQLEDNHHHEHTITFDRKEPTKFNSQVVRDKLGWDREELGTDAFIPLSKLGYNPTLNTQYLDDDDKLYFRVTTNRIDSKTKPWLTTGIIEDDIESD